MNHSTITCPHCGRDSYLTIIDIAQGNNRCGQCGQKIE